MSRAHQFGVDQRAVFEEQVGAVLAAGERIELNPHGLAQRELLEEVPGRAIAFQADAAAHHRGRRPVPRRRLGNRLVPGTHRGSVRAFHAEQPDLSDAIDHDLVAARHLRDPLRKRGRRKQRKRQDRKAQDPHTFDVNMGAVKIDRRSFLDGAGRLAMGSLTAGAVFETIRPGYAWAGQAAKVAHPGSDRMLERLRTGFSFQMSVDVSTIEQGLAVAGAALAGGVTIVEMGTPLVKNAGVSNVVPAFRRQFPDAILLADMKTMDGGGGEARGVYAGGGTIVDFLALAGVSTAKAICAVRDEFRRADPERPRLAFADIMVPHQGPAATAVDVALRMLDAGVDGVGIHLQADARRADPALLQSDLLSDAARAVFERVGKTARVQVVGGLTIAQAKALARAGLRAFVISGNLGQADGVARYNLPPAEIQRFVADFISEVSKA